MKVFSRNYRLKYSSDSKTDDEYRKKVDSTASGEEDKTVSTTIEDVINNNKDAKNITTALNKSEMTPHQVSLVYQALSNYYNDEKIEVKNYSIITAVLNSEKGAGEAGISVKGLFENALRTNNVELVNAILVSSNVLNVNVTAAKKAKESFKKGVSIFASDILEFDPKINYKLQLNIEEALKAKIVEYNTRKDETVKGKIGEMVRILGANYKAAGGKDKDLLAGLEKVNLSQMKVSASSSPAQSSASYSPSTTSVTSSGGMGSRNSSSSSLTSMVRSAASTLNDATVAVTSGVKTIVSSSPAIMQKALLPIKDQLVGAIKKGDVENLNKVLVEIGALTKLGDENPFTLALSQKKNVSELIAALYENENTKKYFDDALKVAIKVGDFEGIAALLGNERKPGFNPFIGAPKEVVSALRPSQNKEQVMAALKLELVKKDIKEIDLEFVKECIIRGELTPAEMKGLVLAGGLGSSVIIINPAAMQTVIQALSSTDDLMKDFVKPIFKIAVENPGGKQIDYIEPILKVLSTKGRKEVLEEGLKVAVSKENPRPKSITAMLQTKGLSSDDRKMILDYKPDGKPLSDWISSQKTSLQNDSSSRPGIYSNDIEALEKLEKLTKTATHFDKLDSALAKAIKNEKPLNETLTSELGSMKTYKLLSSANVLGFEWYDKLLMETLVRPKIVASETYKNIQADYANKKIETRDPYKNVEKLNDETLGFKPSGNSKDDAANLYKALNTKLHDITTQVPGGKDVTAVNAEDFHRLKKVESLIKDGKSDQAKHEVIKDLRAQYKEKLGEVALGGQAR